MKFVTCLSLLLVAATAQAAEPVSFEREVLPLLEQRCNMRHHEDEQSGAMLMDDATKHSTDC